MSHYGLLGVYEFPEAAEDIRGAGLYGRNEEKLGKIKDVIFDHSTGTISYVVVDTGGLFKTRLFLVPAESLRTSSRHEEGYVTHLSKSELETLPSFEEKELESQERWADYEGRYRSKWDTGPVMHRVETERNITPTTEQLQGNPVSSGAMRPEERSTTPVTPQDVAASGSSTERIIPAGADAVTISSSGSGIGGRWDTFQARLRERRKEATAGCRSCTIGPATTRGSDSADTAKKAV